MLDILNNRENQLIQQLGALELEHLDIEMRQYRKSVIQAKIDEIEYLKSILPVSGGYASQLPQ